MENKKTIILVDNLAKTESSNVNSIAYQDNTNTAYVVFKNGGIYQYDNVEREDFETLLNAESVGRHLSSVFLKKGFEFKKLEDIELKEKEVETKNNGEEDDIYLNALFFGTSSSFKEEDK